MESLQTAEEFNHNDDLIIQEKLNLRREARRRNILQNAKYRLERLNGRNTPTKTTAHADVLDKLHTHEYLNGPNQFDSAEFSDPEVEPDIIPQQMLQNETPLDIRNLFGSLNTENTSPQQQRHILFRTRLHLIISALLSCICTFILHESTTSRFSVFIPAGLCVTIDLLFFREQQALHPIIHLVITMCNIRLPSQTKNILHLLSVIQSLLIDIGVFIFSFCVITGSLVYISDRFIDSIVIK